MHGGPRKERGILKRRILAISSEVEKTKGTLVILPIRYAQYVEAELTAWSQDSKGILMWHPIQNQSLHRENISSRCSATSA